MKHEKIEKHLTVCYCILTGILSLMVLVAFIWGYQSLGEKVPVYLAPWGGSWSDRDKSIFYVFRLPVMAICLQGMLLGLYPDRMKEWPDAAYRWIRVMLTGLSLVTLSQLTLNPYFTFTQFAPVARGILLCTTLTAGIAMAAIGYIRLTRAFKPMLDAQHTPFSLLLDFVFSGCRRRRALLIGAVAAFMVLLVIPSL